MPVLRVQRSPMVTKRRSVNVQPSSNTRLPIFAPSSRQMTFFIGVPLNSCGKRSAPSFQNRSCRQNARS